MKAENRNKKITFVSINKNLSLFKIKKKIIQKKKKFCYCNTNDKG